MTTVFHAHPSMTAYVDGERVESWTAACPDGGWVDYERRLWGAVVSAGRKRGRVEVHDSLTGRVHRAERGAAL